MICFLISCKLFSCSRISSERYSVEPSVRESVVLTLQSWTWQEVQSVRQFRQVRFQVLWHAFIALGFSLSKKSLKNEITPNMHTYILLSTIYYLLLIIIFRGIVGLCPWSGSIFFFKYISSEKLLTASNYISMSNPGLLFQM